MRNRMRGVVAAVAALLAGTAQAAGVTLYRDEHYSGPKVEFQVGATVDDVPRAFDGRSPASVLVNGGEWQFCELPGFRGRCVTTGPGNFLRLADLDMAYGIGSVRSVARVDERLGTAAAARASITLYLHDGFQGESIDLDRPVPDLKQFNASDKASSLVVRGGQWQVCSEVNFGGQCAVFGPGRYASMREFKLNDAISSVRPTGDTPGATSTTGGGSGTVRTPPTTSTANANTACTQAVESRVRDEHPRASRVQVQPQSLAATVAGEGAMVVRGSGQYQMPGSPRRFTFECAADARGARINRMRYED